MDLATHLFQVNLKMKLTYRTLPYGEDDDVRELEGGLTESGESPKSNHQNRTQWDDNCPWSEWYSAEDPLRGIMLLRRSITVSTIFHTIRLVRAHQGSDIRPS